VHFSERRSSPPNTLNRSAQCRRRSRGRLPTAFLTLAIVALGLSNVIFADAAGASSTTIFGQAMTPGLSSTLSMAIKLSEPSDVAYDSNGNLFISNLTGNGISVLPASTGTIFGQSVTAGVAAQLTAATGLDEPAAIAFDASGDLFISNTEGNTITVLPASTGTIFGQAFIANQAATLNVGGVLDGPTGLAFDAGGDLFIANISSATIAVVPASSGTLFGQSVTGDVAATLAAATGLDTPFGITLDANGDLFIANPEGNSVTVVPASTGTIFGQAETADVAAPLSFAAPGVGGPAGLAFDANGDLFIANAFGETVTVLPASSGVLFGQAVTANVAATLTAATQAALSGPFGLTFDSSGDLLIANLAGNSIVELASTSVLIVNQSSTLSAATGLNLPLAMILDPNGDLFIANSGNNTISVLPASTGTIFGQAVTANQITTLSAATGLDLPLALAMNANGDLFISNDQNNTISVLPATTGTIFGQAVTANQITTLDTPVGFQAPFGLSVDANGDLFGANINANQIIVFPSHTGTIFGQAVTANDETTLQAATGLDSPIALDFDANGNLFVANDAGTISVIPATTGTIFGQSMTANVAATLTAASGLSAPEGLTFDASGNLFITNANVDTVTVLPVSTGTIFGQSVVADSATRLEAATGLEEPTGITFDGAGDLFVENESDNTITFLPANSVPIFGQTVPTTILPTTIEGLDGPTSMAFDAGGDLFVSNSDSNTITVDPASSGTIFGQSVTANVVASLSSATGLNGPFGIAFDTAGNLYIVNNSANAVTVIPATTGTLFGQSVTANVATTLTAATGLNSPYGIVVDTNGDLLISNSGNNTVTVVPASTGTLYGQSVTVDVATPLTSATGLVEPFGMALDANGDLFISNWGLGSISVLPATTGTIFGQSVTADQTATLAAATGVGAAYDIALDASGDLYISNVALNTVSVIPSSTEMLFGQSVIANHMATLSAVTGLDGPEEPAFDSSGDLFVANFSDDSITVVPAVVSSGPGPGPTGTPPPFSPTKSTVSLSLRSNGVLVRGTPVTLTAALSAPGDVAFTDNGHAIAGCTGVTTATSATCQWTPTLIGANALVATLTPTSSSESASTSAIENVSVIANPGAPSIKRVAAHHERIRVIESRLPATGGAPILGYQYAVNGVWHQTTLGHARQITISGLPVGHAYKIRLRAHNRAGVGPSSNVVVVRLP
jgi:sugar lactone lactonase YvrE